MLVVEIQNLCVKHLSAQPQTANAISDLNLHVQAGEEIAIIGPSGAGKTTLLHTLACAQQIHEGSFKLWGQPVWALSNAVRHALRKRLFLAPQIPPLPPRQRVVTAVLAGLLPQWSFWQALASLAHPKQAATAAAALKPFGLESRVFDRVDRLSGGERQRVSLARAVASNAELLIIDEPLSALDPTLAASTLQALLAAARARKATIICSLHQVELAHAQFARVIGLRDGRVQFDCAREALTPEMLDALYRDAEIENLWMRQHIKPFPHRLHCPPRRAAIRNQHV